MGKNKSIIGAHVHGNVSATMAIKSITNATKKKEQPESTGKKMAEVGNVVPSAGCTIKFNPTSQEIMDAIMMLYVRVEKMDDKKWV